MPSSLDSLLTIPPFEPSGLGPKPRRPRSPGLSLFRTQENVATWRDQPLWPMFLFAWMAALVTFFISLH